MGRPALDTEPADTSYMLAMHNAFRRDLDRLARAVDAPSESRGGWDIFREELEFHHRAEDADLWPEVRRRVRRPEERAIVDQMTAEHEGIGPALAAVADGFDGRGDLGAAVRAISDHLREHLHHEEQMALPLVRSYFSDADWHRFLRTERRKRGRKGAQFLCWVLEDADPADVETVLAELPRPGRWVYQRWMKPRWAARPRWAPASTRAS